MPKLRDLKGQTFGRVTVLERATNEGNHVRWKCLCSCGTEFVTRADNLTSGGTKSCGCFNREQSSKKHTKHGEHNTRLNRIWRKMKSRCNSPNNDRYKNYGGRGITVCDEWNSSFEAFRDWAMANGYRDDLTIDRIDVNGNYEPSNCRWATNDEQQNNRQNNHYITFNGETHTIAEWARLRKLSENALVHRILRGWDVERALSTPIQKRVK